MNDATEYGDEEPCPGDCSDKPHTKVDIGVFFLGVRSDSIASDEHRGDTYGNESEC